MVRHHPAKFGGPRYCGSGDMMFLVVNARARFYMPLLPSVITVYF